MHCYLCKLDVPDLTPSVWADDECHTPITCPMKSERQIAAERGYQEGYERAYQHFLASGDHDDGCDCRWCRIIHGWA